MLKSSIIARVAALLGVSLAYSVPRGLGNMLAQDVRPTAGHVHPRDGWAAKNRVHRGKAARRTSSNRPPYNGLQEITRRRRQMSQRICIDPIAIANFHAAKI